MINSIFSDPFPFKSTSKSSENQESSISSDGGSERRHVHSDEEVFLLATSRPKKRAGRRVFKETRHPIFRGVRRRNGDKWVCELREPQKKTRIWLGTYPTPEMAARAHDVAALALRGKSACLNFADSAWRLPVPDSTSAFDIRRAATEAAEMFRTSENGDVTNGSVLRYDENVDCTEFVDEEAIFDMPGLLVDMAEGLLLSPPRCDEEREMEIGDVSLWSYSF